MAWQGKPMAALVMTATGTQALGQALHILTPALASRFPHYYPILSDKETGSKRLQSHRADRWQKWHLMEVCLMPQPDLTTGMPGSGISKPLSSKVPCPSTPGHLRHMATKGRSLPYPLETGLIRPPPQAARDYQGPPTRTEGAGPGKEYENC